MSAECPQCQDFTDCTKRTALNLETYLGPQRKLHRICVSFVVAYDTQKMGVIHMANAHMIEPLRVAQQPQECEDLCTWILKMDMEGSWPTPGDNRGPHK